MSARAITSVSLLATNGYLPYHLITLSKNILKQMYHFNHKPEVGNIQSYVTQTTSHGSSEVATDYSWAGGRARRMIHCAYVLAFLCLLRVDEVLNIQVHEVKIEEEGGVSRLTLTLPFHKTKQFGGMYISQSKALLIYLRFQVLSHFICGECQTRKPTLMLCRHMQHGFNVHTLLQDMFSDVCFLVIGSLLQTNLW